MNMRVWIILSLAFVTAISLAPLRVKRLMHTIGPWHDRGHILIFFATGALVLSGARDVSARAFRTAAILLFCVAIELVQAIAGHNRFEWRDLGTDAFGIFSAWVAAILVRASIECRTPNLVRSAEALFKLCDSKLSRLPNRIEG